MGILITPGMQLRIPRGGLVLTLDGDAPPVVVEVSLDIWDQWLSIAAELTKAAEAAHSGLLDAQRASDDVARGVALEQEFRAAMQAISATAFAIEALYAAVKERLGLEPELEAAWRQNRTARHRRIAEVMRRAFKVNRGVPELQHYLQRLFEFRSWAVHPPNDFRRPVIHPDLDLGVEWRFVAFSSANARNVFEGAVSLLEQLFALAEKRSSSAVAEWAASGKQRLERARDGAIPQGQLGTPTT